MPRNRGINKGGHACKVRPFGMIAAIKEALQSTYIREISLNVTPGLRRVPQTNPDGFATVDGGRRSPGAKSSWRAGCAA
jgi:hypothetical protein